MPTVNELGELPVTVVEHDVRYSEHRAEDVGMEPIRHHHAALGEEVCSALNAFPREGLKYPAAGLLDFMDASPARSCGHFCQSRELHEGCLGFIQPVCAGDLMPCQSEAFEMPLPRFFVGSGKNQNVKRGLGSI